MLTILEKGQTLSQKVILIVAVSILLRLLVMPFFMHMDMLSELTRVNYSMQNGEFYPGFNRLTVFYIESIFYFFTQWFFVNPDVLLFLAFSLATHMPLGISFYLKYLIWFLIY